MPLRFLPTLLVASLLLAGCPSEVPVASCTPGTSGCSCQAGAQPCLTVDLLCSNGRCVECVLGSQGCGCADGESCVTPGLVCEDGRCVSYAKAPETPVCYTPCLQDLVRDDGTVATCSAEGLLEGCVGDLQCLKGSCAKADATKPPACANDSACPDFQTCVAGTCYSTCASDAECERGWSCFRKVCRKRCNTIDAPCAGKDRACVAYDGENGHCMPVTRPSERLQPEVKGSFAFEPASLGFTNVRTSRTLTLRTDHPQPQELVVHRKSHVEYRSTGRVQVTDEGDTPLQWLRFGGCDEVLANGDCRVRLEARSSRDITVSEAANPVLPRWDGMLAVQSATMGNQDVEVSYASRPDGAWSGSMFYFASFRDKGLAEWVAGTGAINDVENALVQRWAKLKTGQISLDEFNAAIASTVNESWRWPLLKQYPACAPAEVACYPYDNAQGYSVYTPNLTEAPIPTGTVEFPVSLNLHQPDPAGAPELLTGRIVTDQTLHYVGDRGITLRLDKDPTQCTANAAGVVLCGVRELSAEVLVGGRYAVASLDPSELSACKLYGGGSYDLVKTPWLVPGFQAGTALEDGRRYKLECRDGLLPHGEGAGADLNRGLSASNPIPDGRTRVRRVSLVDGALVNGNELLLLFKEHFESFMGAGDVEGFAAYGIMRLARVTRDLGPADLQGSTVQETRSFADDKLGVQCSPRLLGELEGKLGPGVHLDPDSAADLQALADVLIEGKVGDPAQTLPTEVEEVHAVCVDTGLVDNLAGGAGATTVVPCPEGSEVRYFTLKRASADVAWPGEGLALSCNEGFELGPEGIESGIATEGTGASLKLTDTFQQTVSVDVVSPGGCWDAVQRWAAVGQATLGGATFEVRLDPMWRCSDPTRLLCSEDRLDLLAEKVFFPADAQGAPVMLGLQGAVQDAFRYKTRFRSRSGTSVGFAPTICEQSSRALPYCYDPAMIEQIVERVDCAVYLYDRHCTHSAAPLACSTVLEPALQRSFSYSQEDVDGDGIDDRVLEGFERLFAELLIMLGDESYTQAAASRFDLAGSSLRTFEGRLFEPPDGIDLSGGAGFEMVSLYQAAQYYQTALDRFYALSPTLWSSLASGAKLLRKETVTAYFDRLIRASTQKSRVWSEVAARYRKLSRPDLARRVVQRAYTATYLESLVLSRMMLRMEGVVAMADWPEVSARVDLAQKGYRAALLDMRQVYDTLSDQASVFGFAPEYIPFPALEPLDPNAFKRMLTRAKDKLAIAALKEEAALAQSKSYEVDAAAFQSELSSLRMSYEGRLAELCGTFTGDDGVVYPAVAKYAGMSPQTRKMVDPCGRVGSGQIHAATEEVELAILDLRQARGGLDGLVEQVSIEQERVERECALVQGTAKYVFEAQEQIDAVAEQIKITELAKETIVRTSEHAAETGSAFQENLILGGWMTAGYVVAEVGVAVAEAFLMDYERDRADKQRQLGKWQTERQCDFARINSDAQVRVLLLDLYDLNIDVQRKLKGYYLAVSKVGGLFKEAQRLLDEQAESEQLAINVIAARNDPNVRIYKNDAVLAADRTFNEALRGVYEATRVYEYYTSQSYAPLVDLFLVRMVAHGEVTLESYLAELEERFYAFEDQYGTPDTRVEVLSLRDDVLEIPRHGEGGVALSDGERTALMRARLADPTLLDPRGYLTLPFATRVAQLSPLTRNHKLKYVEAQLLGSDLGDAVARVYLRQRGTGTVRGVGGDSIYYRFPDRTAVVNAVVGQQRTFADLDVYRNKRLRDRPVVNTHWELVINQRDEGANKDVNLQSLDDVILYLYYTDFTEL